MQQGSTFLNGVDKQQGYKQHKQVVAVAKVMLTVGYERPLTQYYRNPLMVRR
jgi:hypothetical protein